MGNVLDSENELSLFGGIFIIEPTFLESVCVEVIYLNLELFRVFFG